MITEITKPEIIKGYIVTYAKWKAKSTYEITIKIDVTNGQLSNKSSCDCEYRSFYGQSKKNRKDAWQCRHILHAYGKTIKQSPERARDILIKQGLIDKNHLRRI